MRSPVEIEDHFHPEAQIVLYPGDANEFLATLPDNLVSLIVTSPPYNLGKDYEERLSLEAYLEIQTRVIAQLCRVLKQEGSLCWQVGNFIDKGEVYPLDIFYYPIFKRFNLKLRNRIIWHFGHGLHSSKRFSGRYETLLWLTKTDQYIFNLDAVRVPSKYPGKCHYKGPHKGKPSGNPLGKNPSDFWHLLFQEWEEAVWEIPNVKSNHPEKTLHSCQYPIELAERCVLAFTNEGEWVLDPYAGVGTSLIAALKQGRRALGSEWESKYVEIAAQRVRSSFEGILRCRPLGKPVYQPTGREKVVQIPPAWKDEK